MKGERQGNALDPAAVDAAYALDYCVGRCFDAQTGFNPVAAYGRATAFAVLRLVLDEKTRYRTSAWRLSTAFPRTLS